ncbi:MAG: hypothetical protein WAM73_00100 [Desulfobacterales bacterium]
MIDKTVLEVRRYEKATCFSNQQTAKNHELLDAGNVIEGAMCRFDMEQKQTLHDGFYKIVLERLFDHYFE